MRSSSRYSNLAANSILESVIAISIISVCLYVSVMVYTAVFNPKTSARYYQQRNREREIYFANLLQADSLVETDQDQFIIEKTRQDENVKILSIKRKDSVGRELTLRLYMDSGTKAQ